MLISIEDPVAGSEYECLQAEFCRYHLLLSTKSSDFIPTMERKWSQRQSDTGGPLFHKIDKCASGQRVLTPAMLPVSAGRSHNTERGGRKRPKLDSKKGLKKSSDPSLSQVQSAAVVQVFFLPLFKFFFYRKLCRPHLKHHLNAMASSPTEKSHTTFMTCHFFTNPKDNKCKEMQGL